MENDSASQPQAPPSGIVNYFGHTRHDIIRHVCDPDIHTILSVGCAEGNTEKVLINQYGKTVYGIELNQNARKTAEQNGVYIIGDDANKIDPSKIDLVFDCIIFADILEHLYDPAEVLRHWTAFLREGGIVCISIPNFRHFTILYNLFFKGQIRYCDGGILDKTHLRITTRKMAIEWLRICSLKLQTIEHLFWRRKYRLLSICFIDIFKDFIAPQIILIGKK